MKIEKIKDLSHEKIKNLELKEEKIQKNEAHLVYEPIKKDNQFKIDIDISLKEDDGEIKADSKLIIFNSVGKKIREFLLKDGLIFSLNDFKNYLNNLADIFEKWRSKNLNSFFDRDDFIRKWASKKEKIASKAVLRYKEKIK